VPEKRGHIKSLSYREIHKNFMRSGFTGRQIADDSGVSSAAKKPLKNSPPFVTDSRFNAKLESTLELFLQEIFFAENHKNSILARMFGSYH
jgi:hypothetical protein